MTAARKLKVSLTLSADVLALVDRDAVQRGATRSSVVEHWLRRAANSAHERAIEDATVAYYRSLDRDERAEEEALARSLSVAARRIAYDAGRVGRRRRGRG
jgi:hypothetical protein